MATNPFGLVEQQVDQYVENEAQQPQFQPTLDKEQTRKLAEQYKSNPTGFNPTVLQSLEQHAHYHQVPFYPGDFNFGEAIMQFGKGFASGFTTLETGDHPDNEYENIARSLGHLVGFAPGILAHPLRAVGLVQAARGISKVKSVPLWLSGKATEKVGKVLGPAIKTAAKGRQGATSTAASFLLEDRKGRAISHVAEGAFNLGLASGISAWQGGVDAIMHSAGHGAVFGGVFRTLGNVVKTGDKKSDTIIRAMAGSVFQGLPSTIRGATSAEQVYEYLLGAYFGAGEGPWYKHGASRFMRDMQKEMPENAKMKHTADPSLMGKRWTNLHPEEQAEVHKQIASVESIEFRKGRAWFLLNELKKRGVDVEGKITKEGEVTEEGYDFLNKAEEMGLDKASLADPKIKVPEPEITPAGVTVKPAAERIAAKVKELDVKIAKNQKDMEALDTELSKELAKKKGGDAIRINYAKDKIEELTKTIEKDILEKDKITGAIKRTGTQLETFSENTSDDDVGGVNIELSSSIVGPRALQFTETNLKKVWDVDLPLEMKRDLQTITANELVGLIGKNITRGKNPNTKDLMEKIKTQFQTTLKPEAEGPLRQWMNRLNKGHKQKFLRLTYTSPVVDDTGQVIKAAKVDVKEFETKMPYTAGGVRKQSIEPLKLIEEVYIQNGGKVGKEEVGALVSFDHATMQMPDGSFKDQKLSFIRKEDAMKKTNKYDEILGNLQKEMADKKFYMFGGRGDADKLYFIKFHPRTTKLNRDVVTYLNSKVFNKPSYKEAEDFFVDRVTAKTKRKGIMSKDEAKRLHKKAVKSNILYDLGMNGLTINRKNLNEIWTNKEGFLNNALAYNKRLQILFTPSWAGSREYAAQIFGKKGDTPDKAFIDAGNKFRYIVIPDLKDLPKGLHAEKLLDFDATLYKEHVDGAILGRNDVINYNNKDAGTPESGQNKAFIISPESITKNKKTTELGSLYGKFMFHKAGDKMSEAMKKQGIHYIITESSAKQMGLRNYNNYSLKSKNIALKNDNIYTMDPRHIKYNYSVKQGKDMYMHNARIPKQWFGALNSKILKNPIPLDVIDDIFEETIYKNYKGQDKWNEALEAYRENPDPETKSKILNNIEKVGINNLLTVINSPKESEFIDAAYTRLLNMNKKLAIENAKEDGIKGEDLNEYLQEIEDFNTVTDRIIKEGMALSKKEAGGVSPLFFHKWVKPYRVQVMKNYIMGQIAKPKIKNSLAARMRPYDLALQQDWDSYNKALKELNKRDDIFFLDNDYRNMPLTTYLTKQYNIPKEHNTLGKFWDAYKAGEYSGFKKEAEEVLRAMVVRVPMDSVSGAHALKFMGFTGRNGHGILMHPRVMRALGGADLDGDEAFVFFGGKNSVNEGEGMKKSWKDVFEANKDEYVQYVSKDKINGKYDYKTKDEYNKLSDVQKKRYAAFIPDNKKGKVNRPDGEFEGQTMEDLLTLGNRVITLKDGKKIWNYNSRISKDKIWMYSPEIRKQISQDVVDSRNMLGSVSSMTQTMKAAHDVLSNKKIAQDTFEFEVQKGNNEGTWQAVIEPRMEKEWLDYARRLSSSMVAFTSDPMDVGGVKSYNFLWKQLHDAYFKIKEVRKIETKEKLNKKTGVVREFETIVDKKEFKDNNEFYDMFTPRNVPLESQTSKLRQGIVRAIHDVNSSLFGRNYQAGRNWKEHEVRDKVDFLKEYELKDLTNILSKQGHLVVETERWSDNMLSKIDIPSLKELYIKMNNLSKRFKMEMTEELARKKGLEKDPETGYYPEEAQWVREIMGRSSFTIKQNKFVQKVLDDEIQPWIEHYGRDRDTKKYFGKEALITDDFGDSPGKFYNFIKDLDYTPAEYELRYNAKKFQPTALKEKKKNLARQKFRQDVKDGLLTKEQKRKIIDEIVEQAEDYIFTNDMHDMISLDIISDYIKSNRGILTDDVIKSIHTEANDIKNNSYLSKKETMSIDKFYEMNDFENYMHPELRKAWDEVFGLESLRKGKKLKGENTSKMDQLEVDKRIRDYKKTLGTAQEKRLFEYFLLGSYNRAKKSLEDVSKELGKRNIRGVNAAVKKWYMNHGAKTYMTKLGFGSTAVSPQSIRTFLKKYIQIGKKPLKSYDKKVENKKMNDFVEKLDNEKVEYQVFDGPVEGPKLQETIQVPFIESTTPKNIKGSYIADMKSYEGVVKQDIPKDQRKIIIELAENLKYMHNKEAINLNEIAAGVIGVPLAEMSKQDYIILNNYLKDIRSGSFLQRFFKEDTPDMRARYFMQFPKSVNKDMMKYDVIWLKKQGWFKSKGREVFGTIRKPSWWLEGIQDWIARMGEKAMDLGDKLKSEVGGQLSFYVENISNGETLRQFAIRKMERKLKHKILTENTSMRSKELKNMMAANYEAEYQKMWRDKNVQEALSKEYTLTNPKGVRERVEGREIVERISKIYTNMNEKIFDYIKGTPEALSKYHIKDTKGNLEYWDKDGNEPRYDWKLFVKDMAESYKKGEDIPIDFGIDGLRQIGRAMKIDLAFENLESVKKDYLSALKVSESKRTSKQNDLIKNYQWRVEDAQEKIDMMKKWRITKTGKYDFDTYFPHNFHGKSETERTLEAYLEAVEKSKMPEEDKMAERKKLIMKLKRLDGDWTDTFGETWELYDKAAESLLGKRQDKVKWTDLDKTSPNMMRREIHIPGYTIDHTAYEVYANNIAQVYFTQMNQIFTRAMIKQFETRAKKKGWDDIKFDDKSDLSLTQKWSNYLKLYAQDAMGNPSIIPDYIYNDPGMKISSTPYGWWADNRVKRRMQSIKDKLIKNKTDYPHLEKIMKEISYSTLNKISNLEAKFELASLLAHPKSAVGNVFGGTLHTLQSAGVENWKQGKDIKWLKRINPEWNSLDDINKFVIRHGVIPDFMMHEWGLNPEVIKRGKVDFMKDVVKNMQDGKINKRVFNDLMSKHKLNKSMMQLASNFMSKPEMLLRRQSFMAHYVQAWKRFDGAIDNIDHPFLIEAAKKGVKATQFLYSAPYRPAFARTALGKIMTRFQLWQWNAVRFRNDVRREAKIFGIAEGTPAFEKFKRTLQLDMLVFALSNVFMYSLFETALPAPWNWMQDTADWVFGDEKERERTFMGSWPASVAPLQLVTPPIARLPVAGLDSFIANDWERFANYHIYTMFPFGRIIKDVSPWAKNNLLENPMMVIDKFSGFPLYGMSRMRKQISEEGVYKP